MQQLKSIKSHLGLFIAIIMISIGPLSSHALLIDSCLILFAKYASSPVVSKIQNRHDPNVKSIKEKIAVDPEYILNTEEQASYDRLPEKQREKISKFREQPLRRSVLRSVLNSKSLLTNFDQSKVPIKLKKAFRYFQVALFIAGISQPLFFQENISYDSYELELAPNEFELVFDDIHTWIRIGDHTYDYMIYSMRKDAVGIKAEHNPSVGRVRFNVGEEEVSNLKEFFESEVGNKGVYYLYPHVGTNCMSNVNRGVEKYTSIGVLDSIDRSPTLTMGYFKIRKLLGDKRVSQVVHTSQDGDSNGYNPIIVGDSLVASVFFVDNLIWAQLDRTSFGWSVSMSEK